MLLKDKVIIVTGSTTGIGAATARRVVEEGAKVVVHGLEEEDGRKIAEEIGDAAALLISNLEEPEAASDLVHFAVNRFGKLDGVVNNAALVAPGNIETTSAEFFDKMMRINARAPFLIIKAALPFLKESRGSVVNIGSVNANSGEENLLPYSISKGAIQTLTRNLGDALHRQGVRVNQVNPGWILTENENQRKRDDGFEDNWSSKLDPVFAPSGRIFKPEEIAASVVFFLSDQCGPVSGSVLEMEQFSLIGRNPPKY